MRPEVAYVDQPLAIYAQGVVAPCIEPFETDPPARALDLSGAAQLLVKNKSAFERHPHYVGQDGLKALGAWVPEVAHVPDIGDRLALLLSMVLKTTLGPDPAAWFAQVQASVLIALPGWMQRDAPIRTDVLQKLDQTARGLGVPDWHHSPVDHAGGALVLQTAQTMLRQGQATAAIVIGLDSCCAPFARDYAMALGNGSSQDDPYSAVPAEAASALVLAVPGVFDAPALGVIEALAIASEPQVLARRGEATDRGALGQGLAACLDRVLADVPADEALAVFTDATGERFRGEDYAGAVTGTRAATIDAFAEPIDPAQSFGDSGAATFPLNIGLALALVPGGRSVVTSASRSGMRAGLRLRSLLAAQQSEAG